MLAVPALPVTQSHVGQAFWLFAGDSIGAALAALILAAPLAWLVRVRPWALASLLAVATAIAALFMWQGSYTDLAALLTFAELVTFFLLCWVVAHIAVRRVHGAAHAT